MYLLSTFPQAWIINLKVFAALGPQKSPDSLCDFGWYILHYKYNEWHLNDLSQLPWFCLKVSN